MNGNKYVFLLAALVGILLWNTPTSVSLLVDSHAFYNGSAPCSKCHGDILAQLSGPGSVTSIHRNLDGESGCRTCHANTNNIATPPPNSTLDGAALYTSYCSGCHGPLSSSSKLGATATQIQTGINSVPAMNSLSFLSTAQVQAIATALGSYPTPILNNTTKDYHAAYRPNCIDCHPDVSSINNYQEAHSLIVNEANRSSQNVGLNEACVLCHTTIVSEVVVRNRVVFPFENDSVAVNGSSVYDGTYTTTISNSQPTGLHNFYSGVKCIMCHAPVQSILDQPNDPYPEHKSFGCTGCHRGSGMNAGLTNETQTNYHAAKIKYCSDCHDLSAHQPLLSRDCNQCHQSHGGLKVNVLNSPPALISWGNNKTNNQTLDLTVNASEPVNFNATANQSITTWNWSVNDIDQGINYDNFTTSFTSGTNTIKVNATNSNGRSNTIPWTVTVNGG